MDMVRDDEKRQILEELEATPFFGRTLRHLAMRLLNEIKGYHWCGVYRLEGEELVLDEYVGAETEHTRIPVGRGVCGTAVAENKNQIVPDVTQLTNYLACSTDTRSEIVVLIRRDGKVLGQIDIDSHDPGSFDASDEALLESVTERLALCWEDDAEACRLARQIAST